MYAAQNQSVRSRGETSSSMAMFDSTISRVMWWLYPSSQTAVTTSSRQRSPERFPQ